MATWQPITRICSPGVVNRVYLQSRCGETCETSHYSMPLHLREELPALVSLVRGAGGVAALGGGPGAAAEAAAEPVLGVVTLVIVGELPERCLH